MFKVKRSTTHLFLCAPRIPEGGERLSFELASSFPDGAHSGLPSVRSSEIRIDALRDGRWTGLRGNDQGEFVTEDALTRAVAVRTDPEAETFYPVELRIPLAALGSPRAGATLGLQIRHVGIGEDGSDYTWPARESPNPPRSATPYTWGDVAISGAPTRRFVALDIGRVTQGLEFDTSAGVFYDAIAGKDTVVRAQLTGDSARRVSSARCVVESDGRSPRSFPARWSLAGTPRINAPPARGMFNGAPTFTCFVPGSAVPLGSNEFSLRVRVDGIAGEQEIAVGERDFMQSSGIRLLLQPHIFPQSHQPFYRNWDDLMARALNIAVLEVHRMWPVRAGVSNIDEGTGLPSSAGVRVIIKPPYTSGRCEGDRPNPPDPGVPCSTDARRSIADEQDRLNRSWRALQRGDGRRREQIDVAMTLGVSTRGGSGNSCGRGAYGQLTDGDATSVDNSVNDFNANVIGQEVTHCLGEVSTASPNHDGGRHSRNNAIPLWQNRVGINVLRQVDIPQPRSVMFNSTGASDRNYFLEGFEWNNLRASRLVANPPKIAAAQDQGGPSVRVEGTISKADQVEVMYSKRVDGPPELPPADPASPYRLIFFDNQGQGVGATPFAFQQETEHFAVDIVPFHVEAALPPDAVGYVIAKDQQILHTKQFTAAAPTLGPVALARTEAGRRATWSAGDPDTEPSELRYAVLYEAGGGPPELIASGLTEAEIEVFDRLLPADAKARLIVEVSDGLNTATGTSDAFSVPLRAPAVAIAAPPAEDAIAGLPLSFEAQGLDLTNGVLSSKSFVWREGKRILSKSAELNTRLSAGTHRLTVVARAPGGKSKKETVTVKVQADSDRDGLPNSYEKKNKCLSSKASDSARDRDGDGLLPFAERKLGSRPCSGDSDRDGLGDGYEVIGGPPGAARLGFPTAEIDLGRCRSTGSESIPIATAAPDVAWRAVANVPWLTVTGTGQGSGTVAIQADCASLSRGPHRAELLIADQSLGFAGVVGVRLTR